MNTEYRDDVFFISLFCITWQ